MITELTEEQKDKLAEYRDKWIDIGLSTQDKINKEKAIESINKAYQCAGLKLPELHIFTESPLHNYVLYSMLKDKQDSVCGSVRYSVGDSVRYSVWDSVRASVWDSVWDSVKASVWDSCYGSHDASWLAFYKFFHSECNIDCSKLDGLWQCAKNCGWFIPLENVVLISPKPKQINTTINSRGNHILHGDGKPAVYYCDDFQIHALNGVRVPGWLAMTPSGNLKPEQYKDLTNIDHKAEFIKKIGIDRMVEFGEMVDTYHNHTNANNYKWYEESQYKVIDMSKLFPDRYDYLPYLYMKNQTTNIYHLECCYDPNLSNQPRTIIEALKVRMGGLDPEATDIMFIK